MHTSWVTQYVYNACLLGYSLYLTIHYTTTIAARKILHALCLRENLLSIYINLKICQILIKFGQYNDLYSYYGVIFF